MSLAGKHYLAGIIWCLLLGIAYVVIDRQIKPKVAMASGASSEISIPRSNDGHFYVAGQINGQPLTFMIDTGASTVAIGEATARRFGLPSGRPVAISTAGGMTKGGEISVQTLTIGNITLNNVRVVVLPDLRSEALLGQNVLRHLHVTQSSTKMLIRPTELGR